jgi:arabinose-5-phosphate isomerase
MGDDLLRSTVDGIMSPRPKTIRPQALVVEALGQMNAQAITSLFAIDDGRRPLGILHIHDCLRAGVA